MSEPLKRYLVTVRFMGSFQTVIEAHDEHTAKLEAAKEMADEVACEVDIDYTKCREISPIC